MSSAYIVIEETAYAVDTEDEIAEAKGAMRDAGIRSATVYAGDVDGLDGYPNGRMLFA